MLFLLSSCNTLGRMFKPKDNYISMTERIENMEPSTTRPTTRTVPSTERIPKVVKRNKGRKVVSEAYRYLGKPYKYGEETPRKGFDCSGLCYFVYEKEANYRLPRTSYEQSKIGKKISMSSAKPGDLIFFKSGIKVNHVGIVSKYEQNQLFMVHASTSSGVIETNVTKSNYWRPKIVSIRRIF